MANPSRGPVSPQSRLQAGIGNGSGPAISRQTPRARSRQSQPMPTPSSTASFTTPTGSNLPEKVREKPTPATQALTCQHKPDPKKPSVKSASHLPVERLPDVPWKECPRSCGINAHLPWNAQTRTFTTDDPGPPKSQTPPTFQGDSSNDDSALTRIGTQKARLFLSGSIYLISFSIFVSGAGFESVTFRL